MVEKKIKVLYIAGAGRSGTTLLDQYLGSSEGYFSVGEIKYLIPAGYGRDQRCSCGEKLKLCSVWGGLAEKLDGRVDFNKFATLFNRVMKRRQLIWQAFPIARGREYQNYLNDYKEMLSEIYLTLSEMIGDESIIVDSSKDPGYLSILAEIPNIEIYVLHCIRDPRGVAYSRKVAKLKTSLDYEEYMPTQSLIKALTLWVGVNVASSLVCSIKKIKNAKVNYERYASSERYIQESISSLGLPEPRLVENKVIHTCLGNPSKSAAFDADSLRGVDKRWASEASKLKMFLVKTILFPFYIFYGIRS
ncbi:sulfotransferase [Spongiibacter tropicus]|uniref:sulfotransferase n=1 Tax=Spongiibacter tropicus TaxID=454602 RepID=UPI0024E26E90|nr:sulfotransferase [Spongiibacter tropicus]